MKIEVPLELVEKVIDELNEAKLMMFGGIFTLQDLSIPVTLKRKLIEKSFEVSLLAGELFAYTLKDELIESEIKENKEVNDRALKDALKYFNKKTQPKQP